MPCKPVTNNDRLLIPLMEACQMLGLCRQTMMKHVYSGDLDCVRFSPRLVFFTIDDLSKFIEKSRVHYDPTTIPSS